MRTKIVDWVKEILDVRVSQMSPEIVADVVRLLDDVRAFDPPAGHVVHLSRLRAWPVLTADPDRLRRLAPGLEIDVI